MPERIPDSPPEIRPVPESVNRPPWSVMIPAYNCIRYLGETIDSVLQQDPGPDLMQVEVIDDCSTDGDVAALVLEKGNGRVGYFRQSENVGSLRNFETCINRANGHYIHILHGDDLVMPGYYNSIGTLFSRFPEIGAAISGYSYINHLGKLSGKGPTIQQQEGIIENWLVRVASAHGLQPPAIVIKRMVYEQLGRYYAVHYGEDWEMWVRIAKYFPVAYTPTILAAYRVHPGNISSNFFKSGQSLADIQKVLTIIEPMIPDQDRQEVMRAARHHFSRYFTGEAAAQFWKDRKSFLQLSYKIYQFDPNFNTDIAFCKLYIRNIYAWFKDSIKQLLNRQTNHETGQ